MRISICLMGDRSSNPASRSPRCQRSLLADRTIRGKAGAAPSLSLASVASLSTAAAVVVAAAVASLQAGGQLGLQTRGLSTASMPTELVLAHLASEVLDAAPSPPCRRVRCLLECRWRLRERRSCVSTSADGSESGPTQSVPSTAAMQYSYHISGSTPTRMLVPCTLTSRTEKAPSPPRRTLTMYRSAEGSAVPRGGSQLRVSWREPM